MRILRDLAAGLNRIDEVGVVIHMENERAVRAGPEPVRIDADRLSELYRWYADDAIRLGVEGANGNVEGVGVECDSCLGGMARGEAFCRAKIQDVMTRNPISCQGSDSVHEAMGRMSEHQIGQLPVIEGRDVVGVVSVGDVVKLMHEAAETENKHLLNYLASFVQGQ